MTGSAGAEDEAPDDAWSTRGLPRQLGRYELLAEIGAGGMASVFLARTTGPGRFHKWLAVKRVHPHLARDKKFVEMFLDEARLAAAIQHPNVAQVFDLGEQDGEYFLAMEYMEGEHLGTLASHLFQKHRMRFPIPLAARIVAAAAHGLHQAHQARDENGDAFELVHRDVSPHNIFVTYGGDVKVMDFGVAKAAGRITTTETGGRKGKLAYMSPEQLLNEGVDRRTDIFALGVVLWEITTGRRLFRTDTDALTISRILAGQVARPSTLEPSYPLELEQIVMKALARQAGDRFATAQEMGSELEQFEKRYSTAPGSLGVAGLMTDLFPDRIEQKRQLLKSARVSTGSGLTPTPSSSGAQKAAAPLLEPGASTEVTPPPTDRREVSRVSPSGAHSLETAPAQPPTSRVPLVLGAMILVALIATAAFVVGTQRPSSETTPVAVALPLPPATTIPTPAPVVSMAPPVETAVPVAVAPEPEPTTVPAIAEVAAPATTVRHGSTHTPSDHASAHSAPPSSTIAARPTEAPPVVAATTRIQVLALGAWAHVRIDGREVGQTPYSGTVAVGAHSIELSTDDGRTFSDHYTAADGALLRVTHRFE